MNRKFLAIALAATIAATAGCKPDEAAEAAAAPPAPAAPVDAVTEVVDHGSPAGDLAGFDIKAFAGTYAGRDAGKQCRQRPDDAGTAEVPAIFMPSSVTR